MVCACGFGNADDSIMAQRALFDIKALVENGMKTRANGSLKALAGGTLKTLTPLNEVH